MLETPRPPVAQPASTPTRHLPNRRRGRLHALCGLLLGLCCLGARAELMVFAATSLTDVLPQLAAAYTAQGGEPVKFSFASSSILARQIEGGAQADVFVSADLEWLDYLDERGLIEPQSRVTLAGNRLVLVAPADSPLSPAVLNAQTPLDQWLGRGRLAVGDPAHVPAGRYARAALSQLGLWSLVADRLAPADSVRTALMYVATGDAPLGIVYATDLKAAPGVKQIASFPDASYPAIVYPAAAVHGRSSRAAWQWLVFLKSPAAAKIWQAAGFQRP